MWKLVPTAIVFCLVAVVIGRAAAVKGLREVASVRVESTAQWLQLNEVAIFGCDNLNENIAKGRRTTSSRQACCGWGPSHFAVDGGAACAGAGSQSAFGTNTPPLFWEVTLDDPNKQNICIIEIIAGNVPYAVKRTMKFLNAAGELIQKVKLIDKVRVTVNCTSSGKCVQSIEECQKCTVKNNCPSFAPTAIVDGAAVSGTSRTGCICRSAAQVDSHRNRLTRFFKAHNPAKLPAVNDLVEAHLGDEEWLMQRLAREYGPEPQEADGISLPDIPLSVLQPENIPFVRTPTAVVDAMVIMARIGPESVVFDLGCGDGSVIQGVVAQTGARAVCVERRKDLIDATRERLTREMTAEQMSRIELRQEDFFATDLSSASVIFAYLIESVAVALTEKLFHDTRLGTIIVLHDYEFPSPHYPSEGWAWVFDEKAGISGDPTTVLRKYVVGESTAGGERVSVLTQCVDRAVFSIIGAYQTPHEYRYSQACTIAGHGNMYLHLLLVNGTLDSLNLQGAERNEVPHLRITYTWTSKQQQGGEAAAAAATSSTGEFFTRKKDADDDRTKVLLWKFSEDSSSTAIAVSSLEVEFHVDAAPRGWRHFLQPLRSLSSANRSTLVYTALSVICVMVIIRAVYKKATKLPKGKQQRVPRRNIKKE